MLNKLLKYEFKSTARVLFPLYGVVILIAIINKLIFILKDKVSNSETISIIGGVFSGLSIFLYVAVLAGVMVTTLVIIVQRFRKNLLGDEGYLMNTLPVKPWQNIISKLLIAMLWSLLGFIVAIFTIFILAYTKDIFYDIRMMWHQISMGLGQVYNTSATVIMVSSYLVNFIGGILVIYFSLCVGNLFSRYRIVASFATYLIIDFVRSIIVFIIGFAIVGMDMFTTTSNISGEMTVYLGVNLFLSIVFVVLYYVGCEYIIRKKVNLE